MNNSIPLVINWHVNEACNYGCQYCYAAWKASDSQRELISNFDKTASLLSAVHQFFNPENCLNPLIDKLVYDSVRLNLAGGEPLLHARRLPAVVDHARDLGFDVSIISNGSHLDNDLLERLAPQLCWLGISIDSPSSKQNRAIGRVDKRGRLLDIVDLATRLLLARHMNPAMRLKLNTVVNKFNHHEDLSALILSFAPEKWKVLRMLPVANENLSVSDKQFADFVDRHSALDTILCVEDNQDMRDSYIMIDPHGRFFQNSSPIAGQGYLYSEPILQVGVEAAFSSMSFNHDRFRSRYIPIMGVGK